MDNSLEVENLIQLLDHYGIPIPCETRLDGRCKNTLFESISTYQVKCIKCNQYYYSNCKRKEVRVTWITI